MSQGSLFAAQEFEHKSRGSMKYRTLTIHEKINLKSWVDVPYKWKRYGYRIVIWQWIKREALEDYHLDMLTRPKRADKNYVYDLITINQKRHEKTEKN